MKRILALIMLAALVQAADIVLYSTALNTGGTTTNIISGVVTNGSLVDANGYCRPSDWLPLPEVGPTEQKVVFLYAIFPPATGFDNYGGNYMGLRCSTGNSSPYVVDWGNGNVTTNASTSVTSNGWDYASIPTNTLCSRGYKQVIVTITPRDAGATFAGSFVTKDYRTQQYALAVSGMLDINIEGGFTAFTCCAASGITLTPAAYLERIKSASCVWASGASMFQNAYSLQSVDINTRSMISGQQMFDTCRSLKKITFNSTTNMSGLAASMFNGCSSLQSISGLSLSRVTSYSAVFQNASSLLSISESPVTSNATTIVNIFNGCNNLTDVGTLDLSACTAAATAAFANMYSLQNVRLTNMRTNILAIAFLNSGLSREALTNLFTDLPDRTGTGLSQAITVTGSRGAAALTADDKAIATNKLWTVTN